MKSVFLNIFSLFCFIIVTLLGYLQNQIVVAMIGGCFIGFFACKLMVISYDGSKKIEGKTRIGRKIKWLFNVFYY